MNMHRAVFLCDVHLGSTHCHASELASFLSGLRCQRLYLVGDIVDLWWLAQKRATWGEPQHRVIAALHALARQGCELVYVPGNHDRPMRQLCGLVYANDGDWVESLSVLAEDSEGNLKLLGHTGLELACLSSTVQPIRCIAETA